MRAGPTVDQVSSRRSICRADEPWLVDEHHRVRLDVFVREQQLFVDSDRDERDDQPETIKVVAVCHGDVGGAVRLYPVDRSGHHWQGDRLAVLASHRRLGLGAPLVRFAVATAEALGGRFMTAHIQVPNVRFFEHLGWHESGDEEVYVGVAHVPMAIDLRRAAQRDSRRSSIRSTTTVNRAPLPSSSLSGGRAAAP